MEKKTNVAKKNNHREDQHFSEDWYREGARLGLPTKLPHSVVGKAQDSRDHIYQEYKKLQRKNRLIGVGWLAASAVLGCYFIVELMFFIGLPLVKP